MPNRALVILVLLAVCGLTATTSKPAMAENLAAHAGSAPPESEGWVRGGDGPGTFEEGVNDSGVLAWAIHDTSLAVNSSRWYVKEFDVTSDSTALANGWTLRARLRVENDPGAGGTQFFGYSSRPLVFQVQLKALVNGDAEVAFLLPATPTPFVVPGGATAYHDYEMRYDPQTAMMDLFVDGALALSGNPGLVFNQSFGPRFGTSTHQLEGSIFLESFAFWIGEACIVATEATTFSEFKASY